MVLYISKSIAIFIKLNAKWTNNNILFTHKYAGEKNKSNKLWMYDMKTIF